MSKKFNNVIIENAEILFRDFRGEQGNYPSFAVKLPEEFAKELMEIGWPVKQYIPKDDDAEPYYLINIKVRYHTASGDDFCAPEEVLLIINGRRTQITEATLKTLQKLTFKHVDLEFEWYPWKYQNRTGDGAQLERLYIVAEEESRLQSKWAEEEFPGDEEAPF